MDVRALQREFKAIGATFAVEKQDMTTPLQEGAWWRPRKFRPGLVIEGTRCILQLSAQKSGLIRLEATGTDKHGGMVLVTLRLGERRERYLCFREGTTLRREILTPEAPRTLSGIMAEREAELRRAREHQKSRSKQRKGNSAWTYEEAKELVPMNKDSYAAYEALVRHCHNTKFLRDDGYVIPYYGPDLYNRYHVALMRIARHRAHYVRPLEDWKARSRNAERQFGELLRHLFAHYPIALMMDSVWLRPEGNWTAWYVGLGTGKNIRQMTELPFPLTKRMAHQMMSAPAGFTIEQAIRWGQVIALGGDRRFFEAIERTDVPVVSLIDQGEHAFWQQVMGWFLNHPMLDSAHYGPIVHYVQAVRERDESFCITGRSPQALLQGVEEWHDMLNAPMKGAAKHGREEMGDVWDGHDLDWYYRKEDAEKMVWHWEMVELRSGGDLFEEGREMHHCVRTYLNSCRRGAKAIFSLRCNGKRCLTVEYIPERRMVAEVRGKANRAPEAREWRMVERWALEKNIG